jgi:glyoxylase-like metal-dependent hydrolase (beta-lactamase superfamily II)
MTDCQQFDSNVWLTTASLGYFDVRAVLIRGTQQAVIWDTLTRPEDMQPFVPLLGTHKLHIVYSHADWDHIYGTTGLPYRDADIIGHTNCQVRFARDVPQKLHEKQTAEPGRWDAIEVIPPHVTFPHELVLNLGQLTVILSHLPGHTIDSIVAFLPENGLLLMGDAVETPFPVVKDKRHVATWIAALQEWEHNSQVRTIIPAHGPVSSREILQQNIMYLQSLMDGHPIALPHGINEFYRLTHEMNVRAFQDGG